MPQFTVNWLEVDRGRVGMSTRTENETGDGTGGYWRSASLYLSFPAYSSSPQPSALFQHSVEFHQN